MKIHTRQTYKLRLTIFLVAAILTLTHSMNVNAQGLPTPSDPDPIHDGQMMTGYYGEVFTTLVIPESDPNDPLGGLEEPTIEIDYENGKPFIEIEEAFEFEDHYSEIQSLPGSDLPGQPDREFGAFVVANLNDSDSDSFIDSSVEDTSWTSPVPPPNETGPERFAREDRLEVDLILLEVPSPNDWGHGWSQEDNVVTLDIHGLNKANVRIWKDRTKSDDWTDADRTWGDEFINLNFPLQFWVEIISPSDEIADAHVTLTHNVPQGDPINGGQNYVDSISLSGIWSTATATFQQEPLNAVGIVNGRKVELDGATLPEVFDHVAIIDEDPGFAEQAWSERVWAKENALPNPLFELRTQAQNLLSADLTEDDDWNTSIPKEIDSQDLLGNFQYWGCPIGHTRTRSYPNWGIVWSFNYKPTGIATAKLSSGRRLSIGLGQKAFSRGRLTYYNDPNGIRDYKPVVQKDFAPSDHVALSNDSSDHPNALAQTSDVLVSDYKVYGSDGVVSERLHDKIFGFDAPGWAKTFFPANDTHNGKPLQTFELRVNFWTFSRVSFDVNRPAGNNLHGTVTSEQMKWYTTFELEKDVNAQSNGNFFIRKVEPAFEIDGADANSLIVGSHIPEASITEIEVPDED